MSRPFQAGLYAAIAPACVALVALGGAPANAAPTLARAQAQDLGPSAAADTVTASLILKIQHPELLESFAARSQDPGSSAFHHFLSRQEFTAQFAPSEHDLATITQYLKGFGITVNDVYADHLVIHATGTVDAFERAFQPEMHDVNVAGKRYRRAHHAPHIPLLLRDLLVSIGGFSTEPVAHSAYHDTRALASIAPPVPAVLPKNGAIASGVPGSYTVGDFANMYDVNPLYDAALDGTGRTLGIATLADFLPSDAYTYWSSIGLDVDQHRITQVHVDGGAELSSAAGAIETSLDVEQSGGLAPGAKIIVYDGPTNNVGFLDVFYKAASDNLVDSLSCSWESDELTFLEAVTGIDSTAELTAFHQVLLELAVQGVSVFVASGDFGAFDFNTFGFDAPVANVLTVASPASDPMITAAGGTSTPVVINFAGTTAPYVVSHEQVWGYDLLESFLVAQLGASWVHALFPEGSGGGVSIHFGVPDYQRHTPGIRTTEASQSVIFDPGDGSGPQDLYDLPAHFAGRNVPDISADADPESGYLIQSTLDGGLVTQGGGTSFVAPQLNGVAALLVQATGGRLGLWNPMLYRYQRDYAGRASSPIVDVVGGDNWFYAGVAGYDQSTGLGVLDVANLWAAIKHDHRR